MLLHAIIDILVNRPWRPCFKFKDITTIGILTPNETYTYYNMIVYVNVTRQQIFFIVFRI